jgi:ABC-type amino acid transport system permease subunit
MTSKPSAHNHPSKMHDPASGTERSFTVYVLMAICYLLIALTMYIIWQKANLG